MRSYLAILFLGTILLGISLDGFSQYPEFFQLESAYQTQNEDSLNQFFLNWEKEYQPISINEWMLLSDTIKDIYEIYYDFFNPFDFSKLMKYHEFWDTNYVHEKYIVVPNQIAYGFLEKLDDNYVASLIAKKETKNIFQYYKRKNHALENYEVKIYLILNKLDLDFKDTLKGFFPVISNNNCTILYLTPKYKNITDLFFDNDSTEFEPVSSDRNQMKVEEKLKRREFLTSYIKSANTHGFENVIVSTFPLIRVIYFNAERDMAYVFFYLSYQEKYAIYKKINQKWTHINTLPLCIY